MDLAKEYVLDVVHEEGVKGAVRAGGAAQCLLDLLDEGDELVKNEGDVVRVGVAYQHLFLGRRRLAAAAIRRRRIYAIADKVVHAERGRRAIEAKEGRALGPSTSRVSAHKVRIDVSCWLTRKIKSN